MSGVWAAVQSDPYFLSADNPVATVDQRELENSALRLLDHPAVLRARAIAVVQWRNVMAHPAAEQMDRFDNSIDEFVFNFVLRAVASDGAYPRVLRLMQPAHRWFGHDMPGSRWGGDSPDFTYRMIPIDFGARYEVHGWPTCADQPTVTYTLMANMPSLATHGILDSLDLVTEADGSFVITIDGEPSAGRPNHLQTQPGEMHLLVRDALTDWATQTPFALKVRRLDAPARDPRSEDALAQEAAKQMLESLYYVYYCTQSASGQPANQLRPPMSSGMFGGMATQWGTKSNIDLSPDEALIVTANAAGALFRNVSLCDMFFKTLNYWSRLGSLNSTQMAPDQDGRFTYVIAHHDPGVHNWLDTEGLRRTIFGHRWQAFSRDGPTGTPMVESRLVKFGNLERELAGGVQRIDARGRGEQIARRTAGFDRRFIV